MPIYQKSLAASDVVPITAENFPCLAHAFLFRAEDLSVAGITQDTVVDVVGGLSIGPSGTNGFGSPNITESGCLNNTNILNVIRSGTVASPGTKHAVLVHIGESGATTGNGANIFGTVTSSSNKGIRVHSSGGLARAADGSSAVDAGAASLVGPGLGGTMQAHMAVFEWGVTLRTADFDGATWTDRATGDLSGISGITDIQQTIIVAAGANPAMLLMMLFDDLPGDAFLKAAVAWSYDKLVNDGVKALYPPLAGRS